MEQRAEYFERRLGISWFGGTLTPIVDSVRGVRNELLHVNPERPIDSLEETLLTVVLLGLTFCIVVQGAFLYPTVFRMPSES